MVRLKVDNGKAEGIVAAIVNKLKTIGLDCTKMVSLGSDGAAVMMGKHAGVGKQLIDQYSPYLVHLHCLVHKLALACHDAAAEVDNLKKFVSRFNGVYSFFSTSSIRTGTLAQVQAALNDPVIRMKEPMAVRWLSLKGAVEAMYRCYPSVLATLKEYSDYGNATAKSLHKFFGDFYNCCLTAMMFDVHECVSVLCLTLQSESLLLAEVQPALDMCLGSLESLRDKPGTHLATVYAEICEGSLKNCCLMKGVQLTDFSETTKARVSKTQARYVTSLFANINARFSVENASGELLQNIALLTTPSLLCASHSENLQHAVDLVCKAFGTVRVIKQCDAESGEVKSIQTVSLFSEENFKKDWTKAKSAVSNSYKNLTSDKLCHRIITLHAQLLPDYAILCQIALCLCVTSVECERGFSLQNRLKTKFRCSLKPESVDKLMKICQLGPSVDAYSPAPAINAWLKAKDRRKKRLAQPFKHCSSTCNKKVKIG